MPWPWAHESQGRFEELTLVSEVLKGNPLGDPHARPLWVYVPPKGIDYRYPLGLRYVATRLTPGDPHL